MLEALVLKYLSAQVLPPLMVALVAAGRKLIHDKLPPALIPVVLSFGSAAFNAIATWAGVEGVPADGAMITGAAWEGLLVGAATVGLHQLWKQGKAWFQSLRKGKGSEAPKT